MENNDNTNNRFTMVAQKSFDAQMQNVNPLKKAFTSKQEHSNSFTSKNEGLEKGQDLNTSVYSKKGRFTVVETPISPRASVTPTSINFNKLDFNSKTHSEDELPTPKLTGQTMEGGNFNFQAVTSQLSHQPNMNRLNRFTSENNNIPVDNPRKLFNRAGSFPILTELTNAGNNNPYVSKEFVKVEQLSSDSDISPNQEQISLGRFKIKDTTPKISNNSKSKDHQDEPDFHNTPDLGGKVTPFDTGVVSEFKNNDFHKIANLTELSSDIENKQDEANQAERFETHTTDGVFMNTNLPPGVNLDKIQLNFPPYNDIMPEESNKSSDCRSHPPPMTTEFKSPIPPIAGMLNSHHEFYFDNAEKDHRSVINIDEASKIPKKTPDIKSFTQPINTRHFVHNDENLEHNFAPSPNSHPVNNLDSNSFINNQAKKNRFNLMSSDEVALNEYHHNFSDHPMIDQNANNNDSHKSKTNDKQNDLSRSVDKSNKSNRFEQYMNKSGEQNTPRDVVHEQRPSAKSRFDQDDHKMPKFQMSKVDNRFIVQEKPELVKHTSSDVAVAINDVSPNIESSVYASKTSIPKHQLEMNMFLNQPKAVSLGKGMFSILKQNQPLHVPEMKLNEANAESSSRASPNKLQQRHSSEIKVEERLDKVSGDQKRRLLQEPVNTFEPQSRFNFNDIDNLKNLAESEYEPTKPFGQQQSNKFEKSEQQSLGNMEDDKAEQELENGTQFSGREMPRVRGGAVTQGFMSNDRKRKNEQRRQNRDEEMQRNSRVHKNENSIRNQPQAYMPPGMNPNFQSPAQPGFYDPSMQPPFQYIQNQEQVQQQFSMPNTPNPMENQMPNQQMTLPRPNYPQNYFTGGQVSGFGPQNTQQNDQYKTMGDMMSSMMMFQHNNFKAMIDSHTHLMTKMIDKIGHRKHKQRCCSDSSSDDNE